MLDQLTLWRSSLSDSRSSWRRRILSWKIQHILSCVRKHFTSTALYRRGRYLQPGESTQVGGVLDVDVGGATAAAAVGVLGSLRHGGHCRWFVSRSAVGATLPVGHRSTSESGCGRRARSSVRPAYPAARAPQQPALPRALQGGRPAGARGSCYHPRAPPSQPFIDTPVLTPSRFSFICFAQKFGETLHVLNTVIISSAAVVAQLYRRCADLL